jgi:TolB-like protein
MKNMFVKTSCLTLFVLLSFTLELIAQDKITLLSGEVKEGKISGITETIIKLRYPGEDFDYEIDKKTVSKIEFASGRVEVINPQSGTASASTKSLSGPVGNVDTHNKIAVLPFEFISNDPGLTVESMRTLTQNSTANIIKKEYGLLTLQDPLTTNAILGKNNINHENAASFTPAEIAQLLGVEFVVFGTVNIVNKGSSTVGSSVGTFKEKENNTYNNNSDNRKTTGTAISTGSTTTTVNYDTMVDFRLFNDRGENIYSESRHAFGTNIDAYKGSIEYMVRRTPFGSKYGKK